MKRFLKESWARGKDEYIDEQFLSLFEDLSGTVRDRGTLGDVTRIVQPSIVDRSLMSFDIQGSAWNISDGVLMENLKMESLSEPDISALLLFYKSMYRYEFILCTSCQTAKETSLHDTLLGSRYSRSVRASYIMAFWSNDDGNIAFEDMDLSPHPGQIEKFVKHCIIINGVAKYHYLAKVRWYHRVNERVRHMFGKPVEVWSSNLFLQNGSATYIPIHRIKCRFVFAKTVIQNKNVMIVSPRERYIL